MSDEKNWQTIRCTLELKSPVLATDLQSEQNSAVSLPYVPGSLLRGALIAQWLRDHGGAFDALDAEARAMFLSDETLYLNAYPINHDGQRALPTPAAWRYDKQDDWRDGDRTRRAHNLSAKEEHQEFREEKLDSNFYWLESGQAKLYSPPRFVKVHTQRDARKGRATEEHGAVYRYESLAAGLRLQGLIVTEATYAPVLVELLKDATLWLGRARRAGYGEAIVIEVSDPEPFGRELETGSVAPPLDEGEEFQVTFTSDALLRDEWGQATVDPRRALAAALSENGALITPQDLESLPKHCFARSKIAGGFNRKWSLPLPQTVALAAGSTFVYKTHKAIVQATVERLERAGLGERCNEGFGRVMINWPPRYETEIETEEYKPGKEPVELAEPTEAERLVAQQLAERILRARLDQRLLAEVERATLDARGSGKSQIARLRVVLRDIQRRHAVGERGALRRVIKYLKSVKQRRSARQWFESGYIGEQTLMSWIVAQLRDGRANWKIDPVRLGDETVFVTAQADTHLAEQYALRLIDQVLYAATKDARQPAEEEQ